MIQVDSLSLQFGGKFLFHDVSYTVKERDRIGLTGKNGAGKSTMLKILIDELRADEGTIQMPNNTQIGYLPQELKVNYTKSVYEETVVAFGEIQSLKDQIAKYEKQLETATDYESPEYAKLIEKFSEAQDRLENLGGLNVRSTVEKVLKGLGFANGDFDRPLSEFSGGWQMRIELAKLLLSKPNFVLLDEPTNHLDIESIMWLEKFLKDYPGGIILISHDQRFLDNVTNRTMEIVQGKVYDYSVSYTKFLGMREQRREKQQVEKIKQEKWIVHTKTLIEKFRAKKNKAKFAQTLIRKLEQVEIIQIDEVENAKIKLSFPPAPRSGKIVVNTKNLIKNYDTLNVLNKVNFELERGEKVAFVGKNGEGKTTLSKIIAGKTGHDGIMEIGHNVSIGYFEQHQAESLDSSLTVFQTIDDVATGGMRTKVRSLLGSFLFSGEDADKKVSVLSGGEKSRLAMAKLLLEPVNLLILDEPTNHLDIRSKEILKTALRNFEGSMIIVSHDREFLKGLTDKVYEFKNNNIKPFIGDVFTFLGERQVDSLDDLGMTKNTNVVQTKTEEQVLTKEQRIQKRNELKEVDKLIKKHKNKISKCESNIEANEKKIAEYETAMADPDFYMKNDKADQILKDYNLLKTQVDGEMEAWEAAELAIEELEKQKTTMEQ